jgi:hypothetical protein
MFCCPCVIVHQYSETSVMHVLLRIKSLYMFRALLTHPQEALNKRHVLSVGCGLEQIPDTPKHTHTPYVTFQTYEHVGAYVIILKRVFFYTYKEARPHASNAFLVLIKTC